MTVHMHVHALTRAMDLSWEIIHKAGTRRQRRRPNAR